MSTDTSYCLTSSQHHMLSGVELIEGDIVDEPRSRHIDAASHIFAFDVLFGDVLMRHIVSHVQRSSSCRLFLSYHCPPRMWRLGFEVAVHPPDANPDDRQAAVHVLRVC